MSTEGQRYTIAAVAAPDGKAYSKLPRGGSDRGRFTYLKSTAKEHAYFQFSLALLPKAPANTCFLMRPVGKTLPREPSHRLVRRARRRDLQRRM